MLDSWIRIGADGTVTVFKDLYGNLWDLVGLSTSVTNVSKPETQPQNQPE